MTKESDSIVEKLISDENEESLLTEDGISIKIANAVKYTIGILDCIILASVSLIIAITSYFLIKYKMTE